MRSRLTPARLAFLAAAPFALIAAACGDSSEEGAASHTFTLSALEDSGVTGSAELSQDGDQVTGSIELSGFEPNTAHAMHLHGEAEGTFGCAEEDRTSNHLIDFPDLEADADGNVKADVSIEAAEGTLREGTYVMVHAVGMGETLEAEDGEEEGAMEMEEDDAMEEMEMEEDEAMEEEVADDGHNHVHGTNPGVTCGEAA